MEAMLRHKMVDGMVAVERIALLPIIDEHQQRLRDWVRVRGVPNHFPWSCMRKPLLICRSLHCANPI